MTLIKHETKKDTMTEAIKNFGKGAEDLGKAVDKYFGMTPEEHSKFQDRIHEKAARLGMLIKPKRTPFFETKLGKVVIFLLKVAVVAIAVKWVLGK